MPASLPGSTLANNLLNPSDGLPVMYDLLSGPKGSPLDKDQAGNASTGALSTGIGFGLNHAFKLASEVQEFSDDYTPGVSLPDGSPSFTSSIMYIGGGRSDANVNGSAPTNPYSFGFGIGAAGNGGSRDAGAGPAFTGFLTKLVKATGVVNPGGVVETGWINRSGKTLTNTTSVFGSSVDASTAPT